MNAMQLRTLTTQVRTQLAEAIAAAQTEQGAATLDLDALTQRLIAEVLDAASIPPQPPTHRQPRPATAPRASVVQLGTTFAQVREQHKRNAQQHQVA